MRGGGYMSGGGLVRGAAALSFAACLSVACATQCMSETMEVVGLRAAFGVESADASDSDGGWV